MADYTNYSLVTWTDLTPISSVRLNQVSTNIEQVKIANEDKPKGLLKMSTGVLDAGSDSGGGGEFAKVKVTSLDLVGGTDNRVTLDATRYYRLNLNLPNITQAGAGGEDSTYLIKFCKGNTVSAGNLLTTFTLSSGIGAYIDMTSGNPSIVNANSTAGASLPMVANTAIRSNIIFGGGTYSYVYSATKVNESFFVEIERLQGASTANADTWSIVDSSSTQFYIEDIGGVA